MDLNEIAQELASKFENPILIGGIAAIEGGYTSEATNDVDTIVMVHERGTAERVLDGFTTNRIHGGEKGRGTYLGIHVDVYFEHQSTLGNAAQLDVALLARHRGARLGNWTLLTPPAQFVTKMAALVDRAGTPKGRRDANILYAMIESGVDAREARAVLCECSKSPDSDQVWESGGLYLIQVRSTNREKSVIGGFFGD